MPAKRSMLVDGSKEQSHLDPLTAAPARNRFLKTVVPFLEADGLTVAARRSSVARPLRQAAAVALERDEPLILASDPLRQGKPLVLAEHRLEVA